MAWRFFMVLVGGVALLSGCSMCDSPYDYCGPVVDAGFHPADVRAGSRAAMPALAPESIPAPPPPPVTPPSASDSAPAMDDPPEMEDSTATSVMRPRLRYAR
jgi:hypothetical protein